MKLNTWKIKLLLAEREMTLSDLAVKIGVSRQQVSDLLKRETCTLKTLGRIAKAFESLTGKQYKYLKGVNAHSEMA